MPASRLLSLAPLPAQQVQLLRTATAGGTVSASTGRSNGASSGRVSQQADAKRRRRTSGWCSCASAPLPTRQAPLARPFSFYLHAPRYFAAGTRTGSASIGVSASAFGSTPLRQRRLQPRAGAVRGAMLFSTATTPKQVAFPRHGKAVAPQSVAESRGEPQAAAAEQTAQDEQADEKATKTAAGVPGDKAPDTTGGKRGEAKEEAAGIAVDAATTEDAELASPSSGRENQEAGTTADAPSIGPRDPAGVAASAAAAAATAANVAATAASGIAGGIVDVALPVIELGPPPPNSGPGILLEPVGVGDEEQQQLLQQQDQEKPPGEVDAAQRQPLSQRQPPHMVPPPYVHHFDSYSLVKQLAEGGYTQAQAITAMKAVRSLLAQNLELAQSNLVSKSDVENEAYLFKAACAELSIEVRNNRRRADEDIRQQRSLLQHEVDIAAQKVNQELGQLSDVVKELFNDRKMAGREEQKAIESAVSPRLWSKGHCCPVLIPCSCRSNNSATKSPSCSTARCAPRSRACAGCSFAALCSASSSWPF